MKSLAAVLEQVADIPESPVTTKSQGLALSDYGQRLPQGVSSDRLPGRAVDRGILANNPEGKEQVLAMVEQCFYSLDRFGRGVETLPAIQRLFLAMLSNYRADDVLKAFERYVQHRTEFPKPADILAILDNRVKMDRAVYDRIKQSMKSETEFVTKDERNYVYQYERQVLNEWE